MRGLIVFLAVLAASLTSPPLVAGEDRPRNAAIEFLPDADSASIRWVEKNPRDIAVAIRLGGATTVPVETIIYWLRRDFNEKGRCRTRFFLERGEPNGSSSVIFSTRNHAWGAFSLAESRENVAKACAQHRFEVERGLH